MRLRGSKAVVDAFDAVGMEGEQARARQAEFQAGIKSEADRAALSVSPVFVPPSRTASEAEAKAFPAGPPIPRLVTLVRVERVTESE